MSESPLGKKPIQHRSTNQNLGLVLFAVYCLFYFGFIVVTVYDYTLLSTELFAGVNLAIIYGIGLILLAILLAVIYAFLARPDPQEPTEAAEI